LVEGELGLREVLANGEKLFIVATEKFLHAVSPEKLGTHRRPALPRGTKISKRQPIKENVEEAYTIVMPSSATFEDCVDAVIYVAKDAYDRRICMIEVLLISPYTNKPQTIYVKTGGDEDAPIYEFTI